MNKEEVRKKFKEGFYHWIESQENKDSKLKSGTLFSCWLDACYFASGQTDPAIYARDAQNKSRWPEDDGVDLLAENVEGEELL